MPIVVSGLLLNTLHSGHFGQQRVVTLFPVFHFLGVYLIELRSKGLCTTNVIPGVVEKADWALNSLIVRMLVCILVIALLELIVRVLEPC